VRVSEGIHRLTRGVTVSAFADGEQIDVHRPRTARAAGPS
jgi:hypothetical protein